MDKVIVLNKHSGPTSFAVVEAVRRATGIRKVGHTGTLDPLARGVLVVCTGRATRAVEQFMDLGKTYEFTVRLGVGTTTLDAAGDVVAEAAVPAGCVGRYEMKPPAYSAIKRNGERLYELARAGEAPEMAPRAVTIHNLDVLDVSLPDVDFRIRCSRGTYVRAFARDFGERVGVPAHLRGLVSTATGPFGIDRAFPSERVFENDIEGLQPIALSEALSFLPGIVVGDAARRGLGDGTRPLYEDVIEVIGDIEQGDTLRILDGTRALLALGRRAPALKVGLPYVESFRLFVDRESVVG